MVLLIYFNNFPYCLNVHLKLQPQVMEVVSCRTLFYSISLSKIFFLREKIKKVKREYDKMKIKKS